MWFHSSYITSTDLPRATTTMASEAPHEADWLLGAHAVHATLEAPDELLADERAQARLIVCATAPIEDPAAWRQAICALRVDVALPPRLRLLRRPPG